MDGFTESLFRTKCVANSNCIHGWAILGMLIHKDVKKQLVIMTSIIRGDESRGINYLWDRNRKIYNEKPRKCHTQNRDIALSLESKKIEALDKSCSNKVSSNDQIAVAVIVDEKPNEEEPKEKKDDTSSKSLQLLLYYIQDATLFSVAYANLELSLSAVRTAFISISDFSILLEVCAHVT